MGWWPFVKKRKGFANEPHIRGSRLWIHDLREICERNYDQREVGQIEIGGFQLEWRRAHSREEVDDPLLEGLERRAVTLLSADDDEWAQILDNEDFWKAGWGSQVES